jgi:hypothetical protein
MNQLKRISVPLMILLTVLTLGLYPFYWYFSRRKDLEALKPGALPASIDSVVIAAFVLRMFVFFTRASQGSPDWLGPVNFLTSIVAALFYLYLAFKFRDAFESLFFPVRRRSPYFSYAGTFFLSHLYTQYKINKLLSGEPVRLLDGSGFKPEKIEELRAKYGPKTAEELKSMLSDPGYSERARYAAQTLLKDRGAL